MNPNQPPDEGLELVWRKMERRLAQTEQFAFLVVFVKDLQLAPVLRDRVRRWLDIRKRELVEIAETDLLDFGERTVQAILSTRNRQSVLWVEAYRGEGQADWDASRREFLGMLNEGRSRMEAELRSPLILLLPSGAERVASAVAPDLWHARFLSEQLRSRNAKAALPDLAVSPVQSAVAFAGDWSEAAAIWIRDWDGIFRDQAPTPKLASAGVGRQISVERGHDLAGICLERGEIALARDIADRLVLLTRAREEAGHVKGISTTLQVCIAYRARGEILTAQGDAMAALADFKESLRFARELAEIQTDKKYGLMLVATALDPVRSAFYEIGDIDGATAAGGESIVLRRQVVAEFGRSYDALHALHFALNEQGRVWLQLDDLRIAHSYFHEGLALAREMTAEFGDREMSRFDLAHSLLNIGLALLQQGLPADAVPPLQESAAIRRDLMNAQPGERHRLDDLVATLLFVVMAADSAGFPKDADDAWRMATNLVRNHSERSNPETLSLYNYERVLAYGRRLGLLRRTDGQEASILGGKADAKPS